MDTRWLGLTPASGSRIKYFITVRAMSPTAALSFQRVEKLVGPSRVQLFTVSTVEDALEFLRSERKTKNAA